MAFDENGPVPPTVLPLLKFSHATSPVSLNLTVNWTHISEGDLFVVFDTIRVQLSSQAVEEKLFIRVSKRTETWVWSIAHCCHSTTLMPASAYAYYSSTREIN